VKDEESQSSTRTLIERGRAGDRLAWDRVFGRLLRRFRAWAHGRLPKSSLGAAETHDLVQDAALAVWNRMGHLDFKNAGDLDAYVRQAMINRIRDQARRAHVRPPLVPLEDDVVDHAPSALDRAMSAEAMARYQRAFEALDVGDREALIARAEMGYTFEQIAQLTGRASAAAARMAVNRAIAKLRSAVDQRDE
jgi:RNA polymerase sigma-70 factor (ECF subfamily)